MLSKAVSIATSSLRGEDDQRVLNIRRMVDMTDHHVARGELICCPKGRTPDGGPLGELIAANYLCDRWTAREGASLARDGGKLDKLPEELAWEIDGDKPISITQMARDLDGDK